MAKRSYQSYTPYNGTTVQYYLDDVDDIDDEDTDEDDVKVDDDDRAYKNPRKLPSSECPRNEEQAAFMVIFIWYNATIYIFWNIGTSISIYCMENKVGYILMALSMIIWLLVSDIMMQIK